jgi:tetratricopeptide (TPR) repeat protein
MWHSLVADHFEYLALIGIVALEAGAGAELARRRPGLRPALAGLAVFVIAAFGALSWAHEAIFSNEEALWRDTLRMNPDTWAGHERLGGILASRGLEAEGLEHFNEAVGDSTSQTLARANLGNALSRAGREREAIEQYKIGLTLEDTPLMRTMLGLVYASSGRYDEAIRQCNLALKMDPDSPQTYCALGYVHMKRKEYGPAIDDLRRSIALEPDILESHIILAQAFVDLKRDDDALPELLAVVRIEPRTPWAEALIGSIYLKKGNYPEAVSHLRNAEALNSDDASVPGLLDQALRGAQKAPGAR